MSVTATITTAKAENAVLVPVSAIQTKDGESYVTVVTDDNENGTQTKVETGSSMILMHRSHQSQRRRSG